ncbi:MAG: guanylate kinase [Lachnospiraceae bacterium]|nr:guanylate kinase [Lachnospiraceae bacterium]
MQKIIIALLGKAGAGKDTVARILVGNNPEWHMMVSCTTRPMREGEKEGVNYYYLTNEEFAAKVLNGDMLEAVCFNNWYYGTDKTTLLPGINVGVFNPEGYDCFLESAKIDPELTVIGFYVDVDDKIRMMRQLTRETDPDVKEICRRYFADLEDFDDIDYLNLKKVSNDNLDDLNYTTRYIQEFVENLAVLD